MLKSKLRAFSIHFLKLKPESVDSTMKDSRFSNNSLNLRLNSRAASIAGRFCDPPEARPGELWSDPTARTAGVPVRRSRDEVAPARTPVVAAAQNEAALLTALGLVLIIFGIVLLAGIQMLWPQTSAGLRLLAWTPVAIGSSVTLVGSMRYLGAAS